MAASAALTILRSPAQAGSVPSAADRAARVAYLDAWERGTVFGGEGAGSVWAESLRQQFRLYRQTRLVWNPVPDLTDFWGSAIYPGTLPRDGVTVPGGGQSAIPFAEGTKPELIAAAAQIWWWSGMQAQKYVIPHWAARVGNVLIEIVDDLAARKVYFRPRWAALIVDIDLSPSGDVLFYALEETIQPPGDPAPQPYLYRQEVTKTAYRTFRDGKPWDFSGDLGLGAEYENTWGFVPACWVPHQPTGGPYADAAIGAALPELLAINSLQSQIDDGVARGLKPIITFHSDKPVTALFSGGRRGPTSELSPEDGDRDSLIAFQMPENARTGKIDPSANIADNAAYLATTKADFYRHFPELSMWESLRAMREVAGVAAEILHGDTKNKAEVIRAGTDRQIEKATQMAITMAGVRSTANWGPLDKQRSVFTSYTLESFGRGELDFTIAKRPLVPVAPMTDRERADLAVILLTQLGLPAPYVLEQMGVPDTIIKALPAGRPEPTPTDSAFIAALSGLMAALPELQQPFLWRQLLLAAGVADVEAALKEIATAQAEKAAEKAAAKAAAPPPPVNPPPFPPAHSPTPPVAGPPAGVGGAA